MIKLATIILLSTLAGELQDHPVELRGVVISAVTEEPVPFASVMLLGLDGSQFSGTATNFDGRFKLEDGDPSMMKVLKVSAVGFEPTVVEHIGQVYAFTDYFGVPLEVKQHEPDGPMPVYQVPKDYPSNMPILKIPENWPSDMPIAGREQSLPPDTLMVKMLRKLPDK